jgi:hypothetical protein
VNRELLGRIQLLVLSGLRAIDIFRRLGHEAEASALRPDIRTIQRIVAEMSPDDDSGTWQVWDSEPYTSRLIRQVLGEVITRTDYRIPSLTKTQAEWVGKVRLVAEDMPLWLTWLTARLFANRTMRAENADDLNAFLAFGPWQHADKTRMYLEATDAGRLPAAPPVIALELRNLLMETEQEEPNGRQET